MGPPGRQAEPVTAALEGLLEDWTGSCLRGGRHYSPGDLRCS